MTATIFVRHNIEVAHRLTLLPGKCERIHGHGMGVTLEIRGPVDEAGMLAGLDFGAVKRLFRAHLDGLYDHRLLLNGADPLTKLDLPGAVHCAGDPTTENIARWIGEWADRTWPTNPLRVVVDETCTNGATYEVNR